MSLHLHLTRLELQVRVLRLQLAHKARYDAVAWVYFEGFSKIEVCPADILKLVKCPSAEVERLEVSWLNLDKLVHELDC